MWRRMFHHSVSDLERTAPKTPGFFVEPGISSAVVLDSFLASHFLALRSVALTQETGERDVFEGTLFREVQEETKRNA